MKIPVINSKALVSKEQTVEAEVFGVEKNNNLLAQVVRVFLSNQRKAGAKAKSRSFIIGSGAKIWRQKGTGRARHGNRKAPIFVGGGAAHGPTGEQNFHLKINRKMTKKATAMILSDKLKNKKIFLLDGLDFKKTKEAASFLKETRSNLKLEDKIGFLVSPKEDLGRYLKNINGVTILNTSSLSPYFLARSGVVLMTQGAYDELKKYFGPKND